VSAPPFTAEILRNARIQLRPKRVIAAVVICAAISFTAVAYFFYAPWAKSSRVGGQELLAWIFWVQVVILLIAGGIYCLQSVHREKELNTFDYQRVTRLTPLELALGKLLGPPSMMYFLVLCTMPIALVGTFLGGTDPARLLAAYGLVLLGVVAYYAFALFTSLFLPRGSSAGAVILFLVVIYITSGAWLRAGPGWLLSRTSPFWASELLSSSGVRDNPDIFFGLAISHGVVLVALYVTITAWFLLAVTRNMKRDPSNYEIYSPFQALGVILYLHVLMLGFFEWTETFYSMTTTSVTVPRNPGEAEATFLAVSFWLFLVLGLTLLRTRDRCRRLLREFGARAANWWAALWPAPYVVVGTLLIGAALIYMIRLRLKPTSGWSAGMAAFEISFFVLWLVRDLIFLQWANLRRSRRPLLSGALYLVAYYGCAMALFYATGAYAKPVRLAYTSVLFPSAVFRMDFNLWTGDPYPWFVAMLVLAAEAFVFVYLQRRTLRQILASAPGNDAASAPVTSM